MKKTSELLWQDYQHQELYRIVEQIHEFENSVDLFNQLVKFAEDHFSLEEIYMEKVNYPHKEKHIEEHNSFKAQLAKYIELNPVYDKEFSSIMYDFITSWLEKHLPGCDKDLEKYILESDIK